MKIVRFYFTLDQTFRKGLDHSVCKVERSEGKNISAFYNPNPTSIYLSWNIGGKYFKAPIHQTILAAEFDPKSKLPTRKHCNYFELSMLMKTILSKIEKEYMHMRTNELAITPETVKEMVRTMINGNHSIPEKGLFWGAFDEFLIEKEALSKLATVVKYKSFRKTLQGFEKAKRYSLNFESINMKFYTDFLIYSFGLGRLNNTISKDIIQLKSYMNWSLDRRYHRSIDFKRFKAACETSDPIFLTMEELELIEQYYANANASQALSKDIFLFLTYTGQRISDLIELKCNHIKGSQDDDMEWELYQQKGNKKHAVHIYLIDKARKIIEKYMDGKGDYDHVFPRQSPVITNRNLKKIGEGAGLITPTTKVNYSGKTRKEITLPKFHFLSTHTGRRTFITMLCGKGVPDCEIQATSGHKSSKELRPYRGVLSQNVKAGLIRAFEEGNRVIGNML